MKGPAQLSSAYHYAGGQAQRQNQNVRLPEGPELTAEQLEMVESQFKVSVSGRKLKNSFQLVAT